MRALKFGISRGNGGPNLLAGAQRFADVCGAAFQTEVTVSVAYDYERLLRDLIERAIDLAWMPPLTHLQATKEGAELVAVSQRGGRLFYRSAILVKPQAGWSTMRDIRRARAAWADPSSASGYLFPRLLLMNQGIDPARLFRSERFYGAATSACRAVSSGEADLCACFVSSADQVPEAQREVDATFGGAVAGLKVLALTEPIPPDGIVFASGFDRAELAAHRRKLLHLHHSADGKDALKQLLQAEQLAAVSKPVVQALESLRADLERAGRATRP